MGLFRKKTKPATVLERLEKIKIKIDRKIAQLGKLMERKGIKETTRKKLKQGIDKLAGEGKRIIETIEKLSK